MTNCCYLCLLSHFTMYHCTTWKPCCRRELQHDAGHLYRNLAPNPWATQWTETNL